ncbi:MAG: PLDc N-terminal domain-containing protein [Acidimicrobiia bacterium]|nr:MAG: PLDc N-terminal domain-containing protein [Acidimicrobiia bacterium]
MPLAALVPLVVLAAAWIGYCWFDLSRSEVRHLPRWGWALVIALSVPIGGILYLTVGRDDG